MNAYINASTVTMSGTVQLGNSVVYLYGDSSISATLSAQNAQIIVSQKAALSVSYVHFSPFTLISPKCASRPSSTLAHALPHLISLFHFPFPFPSPSLPASLHGRRETNGVFLSLPLALCSQTSDTYEFLETRARSFLRLFFDYSWVLGSTLTGVNVSLGVQSSLTGSSARFVNSEISLSNSSYELTGESLVNSEFLSVESYFSLAGTYLFVVFRFSFMVISVFSL
jgi:hypothetical protein